MRFSAKWVTELERDVKAMKTIGCKFGIIVIRWFGRAKGEYFALINLSELDVVEKYLNIKFQPNGKVVDRSTKKNGTPLVISTITRAEFMKGYNTIYKFGNHSLLLVPLSVIHEALINADSTLGELQ